MYWDKTRRLTDSKTGPSGQRTVIEAATPTRQGQRHAARGNAWTLWTHHVRYGGGEWRSGMCESRPPPLVLSHPARCNPIHCARRRPPHLSAFPLPQLQSTPVDRWASCWHRRASRICNARFGYRPSSGATVYLIDLNVLGLDAG